LSEWQSVPPEGHSTDRVAHAAAVQLSNRSAKLSAQPVSDQIEFGLNLLLVILPDEELEFDGSAAFGPVDWHRGGSWSDVTTSALRHSRDSANEKRVDVVGLTIDCVTP